MTAENTDSFNFGSLGSFAGMVGNAYMAREERKATEAQAQAAVQTANANLQTSANQAQATSALAQANAMTAKTKMIIGIAAGVVVLVVAWLIFRKK